MKLRLNDHYDFEEIEEMMFDSVQPAHCIKCGFEDGWYEPDYQGICPECGGDVHGLSNLLVMGYWEE